MGTSKSKRKKRRKCLGRVYACIKASLMLSSFFFYLQLLSLSHIPALPETLFLLFYFFSSSKHTDTLSLPPHRQLHFHDPTYDHTKQLTTTTTTTATTPAKTTPHVLSLTHSPHLHTRSLCYKGILATKDQRAAGTIPLHPSPILPVRRRRLL